MKKKFLLVSVALWTAFFGIFSLSAQNNRVQIVSENFAAKGLSTDGAHIRNAINKEKTDLVNGNVAIEITIDNSKFTEVIYAIDNGSSMSSIKESVIDTIKTNALFLESMDNVKQGIVTTTDGNISLVPLDNTNIEINLDNIKTSATGTKNGEIFDSIDKAVESFSNEAEVKVLVINLASMPTLSSEEITNLKNKIDKYTTDGIKIIAYNINLNDKTNFNNIFNSATKYNITTNTINEIKFKDNIMDYLPSEKPAIATEISYHNYILSNFDIKDIAYTDGQVRRDETTNNLIWEIGNIKTNQVVKLTYYLSLRSVVDESIIEKINLRTNKQIRVTQSGSLIGWYPEDDKIDDQICSPTIMVLREAIDNPKTGITDYIVFGACILAVSAITIVILNSKKEFNRI